MTVSLSDPNPNPPESGNACSVTATDGTGPYKFTWKVNDGVTNRVEQAGATLNIDIPPGSTGEILTVNVEDANQDSDGWAKRIS